MRRIKIPGMAIVSGHVKLAKRKRGDVWFLKYRMPSGKQLERRLGPAWTERSRPSAGFYTRKMAEEALSELLTDIRRGAVPDPGERSGKTFATPWRSGFATPGTRRTLAIQPSGTTATKRRGD